jgi:hypothetical protein
MKKLLIIFGLLYGLLSYSQAGPTLGVGLEALTLNKGTIDVEVLTKIIMQKQKELKNEALKRFMFNMFPETNYTSRYYVQNCLNILLNEKNPQVIEKEILELTTNYAIALGVTKAIDKIAPEIFKELETNHYKKNKKVDFDVKLNEILDVNKKNNKRKRLNKEIQGLDTLITYLISENEKKKKESKDLENKKLIKESKGLENKKSIKESKNDSMYREEIRKYKLELIKKHGGKSSKVNFIKRKINRQKNKKNKLLRVKLKYQIDDKKDYIIDTTQKEKNILFGLKLDIVSFSLSKNEIVLKKGFFKNKIDFTEENNHIGLSLNIDVLKDTINNRINPYIENYEIIKVFLKNTNIKESKNIAKDLIEYYKNQLKSKLDLDNNTIEKDKYKSLKDEVDNLVFISSLITSIKQLNSFDDKLIKVNDEKSYNELNLENKLLIIKTIKEKVIPSIEEYNKNVNQIDKSTLKLKFTNIKTIDLSKNLVINKTLKEIEDDKLKIDSLKNQIKLTNNDSLIVKGQIENLEIINKLNYNDIEFLKTLTKLNGSEMQTLESELKIVQDKISMSNDFFEDFLDKLIKKIEEKKDNLNQGNSTNKERIKIASVFADLYEKIIYLKNNNNISLEDIYFLEHDILKKIYEVKLLDSDGNEISAYYDTIINNVKNITPLLKIKLITDKKLNFKYSEEVISLFEFIGNLNNLNKAETYTSIIDLLRENSEVILTDLPEGKFKEGYKIFINGMKKYTLINPTAEKEYVEIDIVSFLNDLQQYYDRNNPSKFSLYLSVGLNQNLFFDEFTFPDSSEVINSIGFASEKIGVKYKLLDFKKYRGYENVIKSDVYLNKRSPFINEWYVMTYGSGLLYSLANTSTNQNFSFAHIGFGTGLRFYNALDVNLTIGFPFVKNENFGKNGFIGLGLDIPLGEYLEGLGNK